MEEEVLEKQKLMLKRLKDLDPEEVIIENIKITKDKNVFYPHKDTILLAKSVSNVNKSNILEVGTGSGFVSIYLSKNAESIEATDINPDAIKLAKENAALNSIKNISFFLTNLFPQKNKKYDLIVANLPYTNHPANNIVEKSVWDENHETLKEFLENVENYLKPSGRIFLSWANFADFNLLENLLEKNNFNFKIVAEELPYRIYSIVSDPNNLS